MGEMTRAHGMVLFALGIGVFAGTTNQLLPAVAFWPALVVSCIGAFVFMKANRVAMQEAERRARKAIAPKLRNQTMERLAEKRAGTDGHAPDSMGERELGGVAAQASRPKQINGLVLYEGDDAAASASDAQSRGNDFVVTNDISFPLELQEQGALADQLEKLKKLQDAGIISAEEFATAKSKLLA